MQRATVRSIEAITAIEHIIREIGDISGAIAAAVTEQGAATAEIARSVEIAAKRTVETADGVNLVGTATEDTRSSASAVKTVADDLGSVAGRIRGQVDAFFERLALKRSMPRSNTGSRSSNGLERRRDMARQLVRARPGSHRSGYRGSWVAGSWRARFPPPPRCAASAVR